ncbi:MAG: 4-diphosphocytidyl-2-C-methyl-D-erythritol kinase [Thermoleophilaceae bacterium]|nr:4-diphosphocytidyl-2-C-methyl-D-erythritol kinase [Thermoleophilaceae bacterium]
MSAVHERAFAKLNLILHVGRRRADGMHPLGSVFASIDLCDDVRVEPAEADTVECPGLAGPNLAGEALAVFRRRVPELPPLRVQIDKRIPVAAGLGGGSADAAAVLRAANGIAGDALDAGALRELAAELGSDVPSQVDPRHALVSGIGEVVQPVELPAFGAVLVPSHAGLSTAQVYAEFDRLGGGRRHLDVDALRSLVRDMTLLPILANDLQPAAIELRPELPAVLASLRGQGALGALVSGSGPTCFGLFEDRATAEAVAARIDGALASGLRAR